MIINSLIKFASGGRPIASELNWNFETLIKANNDQEKRIEHLESQIKALQEQNNKFKLDHMVLGAKSIAPGMCVKLTNTVQ